MLRERYRLPVRSAWREHQLQVEALAALAAWIHLYDAAQTSAAGWTFRAPGSSSQVCRASVRHASLNSPSSLQFDTWRGAVALPQTQLATAVAGRAQLSKTDAKRGARGAR